MFPGLGHHAFVGGHDQEGQVDGADASQHVLDEPLVARHVHHADLPSAGQGQPSKAQVDGHLPLLLLWETVGIDVGQGLDQGGLAVVHVAGSPDDVHG